MFWKKNPILDTYLIAMTSKPSPLIKPTISKKFSGSKTSWINSNRKIEKD